MPKLVERQANTPEQMREYMGTALAIWQEYNFPPEIQEAAFVKLCDWAAAKSIIQEPTAADLGLIARG